MFNELGPLKMPLQLEDDAGVASTGKLQDFGLEGLSLAPVFTEALSARTSLHSAPRTVVGPAAVVS